MVKIKSKFAILDVTTGAKALAKRLEDPKPIPVTITGFIDGTWSSHDGTSQEFSMVVEKIELPQNP